MQVSRCNIVVHRRDTYRRTGRTKSGFELHYSRGQCKRNATAGETCKQHAAMIEGGWNLLRVERLP